MNSLLQVHTTRPKDSYQNSADYSIIYGWNKIIHLLKYLLSFPTLVVFTGILGECHNYSTLWLGLLGPLCALKSLQSSNAKGRWDYLFSSSKTSFGFCPDHLWSLHSCRVYVYKNLVQNCQKMPLYICSGNHPLFLAPLP